MCIRRPNTELNCCTSGRSSTRIVHSSPKQKRFVLPCRVSFLYHKTAERQSQPPPEIGNFDQPPHDLFVATVRMVRLSPHGSAPPSPFTRDPNIQQHRGLTTATTHRARCRCFGCAAVRPEMCHNKYMCMSTTSIDRFSHTVCPWSAPVMQRGVLPVPFSC